MALPSDKGCYLFLSYVDDELTVKLSRRGGQKSEFSFKLAPRGQYLKCLDPARYGYEIKDPKWTVEGEMTVEAGKHRRFPITGTGHGDKQNKDDDLPELHP